jgi:hypothetical protein
MEEESAVKRAGWMETANAANTYRDIYSSSVVLF